MDIALSQTLMEAFQFGMDSCIMEYHYACADLEHSMTEAVEVLETAILVGGYEAVEESAETNHLESVCEGAISDFFKRIVEMFKKAIEKIRAIGKKIMDKIKSFTNHVETKRKTLTPNKEIKEEMIKWPNGFEINLSKGCDNLTDFSHAADKIQKELSAKFGEYAELAVSGNDDKVTAWIKNNEKLIKIDPTKPAEKFNEYLKIKFGDGDSAIRDWIHTAFMYKAHDENYELSKNDVSELAMSAMTDRITMGTINTTKEIINLTEGMLAHTGRRIEGMAKRAADRHVKYANHLQFLGGSLIRYSEFGVITAAQTSSFAVTQYNKLIDALVNMGVLVRKKAA